MYFKIMLIHDILNYFQTHSFSGSSESMNVVGKTFDNSEVHGAALNNNDIDAIKKFIQDYASKALLPYIEKQIAQITEVVCIMEYLNR